MNGELKIPHTMWHSLKKKKLTYSLKREEEEIPHINNLNFYLKTSEKEEKTKPMATGRKEIIKIKVGIGSREWEN